MPLGQLSLGVEVGDGGEGTVWEVVTQTPGPRKVLKRYRHPLTADRVAQLGHLVTLRQHLRFASAPYAWPEVLVTGSDGELTGVVLPRVPSEFWATVTLRSGGSQPRLREAQYLLFGTDKLARIGLPLPGLSERLELLGALVAAIGHLHAHGLVYGDLSARNLLYSTERGVAVFLLDCDGIAAVGSDHVVDSPDWQDPSMPSSAQPATDVYKLGLFAARVLAVNPTTRTPPGGGATPQPLLGTLRAMLAHTPAARPDIDEVAAALADATPGPSQEGEGLPRWGLRRGSGELVGLALPGSEAQSRWRSWWPGARWRRSGRWRSRSRRSRWHGRMAR